MNQKSYMTIIVILATLVAGVLTYTLATNWDNLFTTGTKGKAGPADDPKLKSKSTIKTGKDGTETTRTAEKKDNPGPGKPVKKTDRLEEEIAEAKRLENENKYLEARKVYRQLLSRTREPARIQEEIYRLNITMLFSPLITGPPDGPKSEIYTIEPGDTLVKIAKQHNTTIDLLKGSNRISDPRNIQIGDRLKVVTDTFTIIINRTKNELSLIAGEIVIRKYAIGTGKFSKTPLGDFTIRNKMIEPPWKGIPYGDKEKNILGTRWMGIMNEDDSIKGYGIHGTWQPETIGKSVSQGCVRMHNRDVEELFKIVPVKTKVHIIE